MSTAVFPAVVDAIVSRARAALPDVNVADCRPDGLMLGDWLLVGTDEMDGAGEGGSFTQSLLPPRMSSHRQSRDEVGTLSGVIFCAHGDDDAKGARDVAFAILAALETFLRADIELAGEPGTGPVWTASLASARYTALPLADYPGACVVIYWAIGYTARV